MCVDHLLPLVTPVKHTERRPLTRNSRRARRPSRGVRAMDCYYGGSGNPRRPRRHLRSVPMTSFDLDLTKYQLGWSDEVEYAFAPARASTRASSSRSRGGRASRSWMTAMRLRACALFERKPMAPWFAVNMPDIDFQDIYYYLKPVRRAGRRLGRAPRADEGDVREARHPRGRAPVPRRRHRAVRVRSGLPPQPRGAGEAGDPLLRHGHGAARVPRHRQALLRHRHPPGRQQVRRPQHERVERAARSSTCRPASTSRCRCRPTSGSTPRTPASSSAR